MEKSTEKRKRRRQRSCTSRYSLHRQRKENAKYWQECVVPLALKRKCTAQPNDASHGVPVAKVPRNDFIFHSHNNEQDACSVKAAENDGCNVAEDIEDDAAVDAADEKEEERVRKSFSNTDYVIDTDASLSEQLARWTTQFNIPGVAVSVLLKILAAYNVAKGLPLDSRTILKTKRSATTRSVSGGEYYHFGLEHGLTRLLCNLSLSTFEQLTDTLNVNINMDGLPCFKSVNTHIWPILCSLIVKGKSCRPFTIGVFYGRESKKRVDEYLSDFVEEYNKCRTAGFSCRNRKFKVNVWCVICDAPARAFIKNVQLHNAYHGCERCTIEGEKLKGMNYNEDDCQLRTDRSVKNMTDENHHRGPCPLSKCDIKLVTQFVLDYMHLVLLGVLKRIICYCLYKEETKKTVLMRWCRFSLPQWRKIDARLLSYIDSCPSDFARKPRSLHCFKMWKATELRTLLLYTGVVAFNGEMDANCYANFKLLMCAMRVYLSDTHCADRKYRSFARNCLRGFVKQYRALYGRREVVYNVHNLLHLPADCEKYGNLDNISAFPFENHLHSFRRMIRSGNRTMQQIIRRLDEGHRYGKGTEDPLHEERKMKSLHVHSTPIQDVLRHYRADIVEQCKAIKIGRIKYSLFKKDSCIRLENGTVCKIVNIVRLKDKSVKFVVKEYTRRAPYFSYPCNSELLGISRVNKLTSYMEVVDAAKCRKCWLMPIDDDEPHFVAIDLL